MLILKSVVIICQLATAIILSTYAWAITSASIEDARKGVRPRLDATGRSIFAAAKYGFSFGLSVLFVSLFALSRT